ncbi:MAG: hypothetical protein CMC13_00215 [Flavobacteriaceae bacterium]|nr:hypothetical protein [Flavobacteriaceae bacterium]
MILILIFVVRNNSFYGHHKKNFNEPMGRRAIASIATLQFDCGLFRSDLPAAAQNSNYFVMRNNPQKNSSNAIESLRATLEKIERQKEQKLLKEYLSNLGVKLTSFPLIHLN